MAFSLPDLPYATDALEPSIDKTTMEIHHGKHHATYVNNLNKAVESAGELADKSVQELLANNCAAVRRTSGPRCEITAVATPTIPSSGKAWDPVRVVSRGVRWERRSRVSLVDWISSRSNLPRPLLGVSVPAGSGC